MELIKDDHISKIEALTESYKSVLKNYFSNQDEKNLYQAYTLSHNAIESNVNLLELLNSYQNAILQISLDNPKMNEIRYFLPECLNFLSETLAPFEMKLRGYQDAIRQLKSKTYFLEQEQAKINHIVDRLESGLMCLDINGNILLVNSALKYYFLKYFKFEISDGNHIKQLPKNVLSMSIDKCFEHFKNESFDLELTEKFYLNVVSNVIFSPDNEINKPLFLIIEFHDISTFKQFNKLRNSFISMVSHELRSPLSSISLSIKNMTKYSQNLSLENRQRLENIILVNSELMQEIIEDLLFVSQIDENKMILHYKKFSIMNLINNVLLQLGQKIEEKKIVIEVKEELDIIIEADNLRIEQVLRILIDNAIKYSYNGGRIIIRVNKLLENDKMNICISVQDYGRGIRESDLRNLFQRFFRSKDVHDIHGTGLGLAIAKELIIMHKGRIDVISKFGEGSTFKIIIPELKYE